MEQIPIIFIHKFDSDYLKYTLKSAALNNPKKKIILLGDQYNKHHQSRNIEHVNLSDYENSEETEIFENVYQFVAGKVHKKMEWTKFVFKRWFIILNYIRSEGFESFWTFDSDNIIFTDLSKFEGFLRSFDCTTQCNDICMNGFVSNQGVVKGYIDKMNELFCRKDYLDKQRNDFIKNPHYAFTEMRAFETYKQESEIKTFRLNTIRNNETFDECICNQHGMEAYQQKLGVHHPKKLYYDNKGSFYTHHLKTDNYVKLNSINLSWTPIYLFKRIYNIAHKKINISIKENEYKLLDISEPVGFKVNKRKKSLLHSLNIRLEKLPFYKSQKRSF